MARRGQDHDAGRGLLEELMTVLLILSAKCITAVVLITIVLAFPLNQDQESIDMLVGWLSRSRTVQATCYLSKVVVESK